jgi:hypothetical protein
MRILAVTTTAALITSATAIGGIASSLGHLIFSHHHKDKDSNPIQQHICECVGVDHAKKRCLFRCMQSLDDDKTANGMVEWMNTTHGVHCARWKFDIKPALTCDVKDTETCHQFVYPY